MTKKKHPYAKLLIALADGETLQFLYAKKWCDWTTDDKGLPEFEAYDWRVKPDLLSDAEDLIVKYTLEHNPNTTLIFSLVERIRELERESKRIIQVPSREVLGRKFHNRDTMTAFQAVYVQAIRDCGFEVKL